MLSGGSAPDGLTQIYLSTVQPANLDRTGKTPANLKGLNPATTGIFIMAGQSIGANSVADGGTINLYTPTHLTHIYNVSAYDGSVTFGQDPLIGTSNTWANYQSRMADILIQNGRFTDVVLAPVSIAGSALWQWVPGAKLYENFPIAAAQRLRWWGFEVTSFLWDQGTSDLGTAQATYQSQLTSVIANARSAGFSAPWMLAKSTMQSDNTTVSTVRAAIDALVDTSNHIYAGPDLDTLSGSTYRNTSSLPHFNSTGSQSAGILWDAAIHAVF